MGIFDRFTGRGDGYTGAQRTGLQRSAEIKKKRKEEERAFEKTQERERGERALAERRMIETGATRRTAMGEAGATGRQAMSNIGMMARQRLVGEQGAEAAGIRSIREANVASMKHAQGLTTADIKHGRDIEMAKTKARDSLSQLLETPTGTARGMESGGEARASRSILTDFLDMDDSEKRTYMDQLKKKDPDAYLALAKQYKMWSAPEKELQEEEETLGSSGGSSIYQSKSGTYRNF